MRFHLFLFICFLLFSNSVTGQTSNDKKVRVFVDKQTGKMYSEYDIIGNFGQWQPQGAKYVYRITSDTSYIYIDNRDQKSILSTQDSISKLKLNKSIILEDLVDLTGKCHTAEELDNKVIVFNFWAINCRPCVAELPELNKLVNTFSENDVTFFAPTADDNTTKLEDFLSVREFKYKVIPNSVQLAEKLNAFGLPTHAIIDKDGVLRFLQYGGNTETIYELLKEEIKKYL